MPTVFLRALMTSGMYRRTSMDGKDVFGDAGESVKLAGKTSFAKLMLTLISELFKASPDNEEPNSETSHSATK